MLGNEVALLQGISLVFVVIVIFFILSKVSHKIDDKKTIHSGDWNRGTVNVEDKKTDSDNGSVKLSTSNNIDVDINNIIVVSSSHIFGSSISGTLGIVRANSVRSKHLGRDIAAEIKGFVGGEIKGYTEMTAEAREEVVYRMKQEADSLGANAIVDARFETSSISSNFVDILVYGTAVIINKDIE